MIAAVYPRIGAGERQNFDEHGYIILRQAFSPQRIRGLREAIDRVLERAATGQAEGVRWIDQYRRVPQRIKDLLSADKYQDEFGQWLDQDLSPQIETLLEGPAR